MDKIEDDIHLAHCLDLIESKLKRGDRNGWSNYDFERLIDEIQKVSGVRLSLTTLKRVSGRIKYDSFPTHTTLNALARYAGFQDWRDFTHRSKLQSTSQSEAPEVDSIGASEHLAIDGKPAGAMSQSKRSYGGRLSVRRVGIWLTLSITLVLALYLLIASRKKQHVDSSLFSFSADKVFSTGVPNSVVFHYDASAVPSDSVFIVQTWDVRRKAWVSRDAHEHSAIYYYPGFFRTKLIVDGEVVKTHDLQIASDGWLCLAEQEPRPLYFRKDEYETGDSITVGLPTLQKYNLSLHPTPPRIRIFNQGDMDSLTNDTFVFETQLKNPFNEGSNKCQFAEVLIQCKDDIMIIPLSARACVGELFLYAFGYGIDSKHGDLSAFGCDLTEWTTLRIETLNKHMKLLVNNRLAYELDFPDDPTGIVGVQYRFNGTAAVRGTRFESKGRIYELNEGAGSLQGNQ